MTKFVANQKMKLGNMNNKGQKTCRFAEKSRLGKRIEKLQKFLYNMTLWIKFQREVYKKMEKHSLSYRMMSNGWRKQS